MHFIKPESDGIWNYIGTDTKPCQMTMAAAEEEP